MSELDPVLAFGELTPDQMLDAVESSFLSKKGQFADGSFLALNSYENRVYQIGVEDDAPLVAKFYRPARWSDDAILEEHAFTLELADAEIPVIPPLKGPSNDTLFFHGPFRLALYPCRGGRSLELDNEDHVTQMGRFIARMHNVGAAQPFTHRPGLDPESYVTRPSSFLLERGFIPTHLEEAYDSVITVLGEHIGYCYDRAGMMNTLRLHGDFHAGNVLWTDDGPHIVDLDDTRTGPAIQDLWMLLSGDRTYMEQMLKVLLEGYCQFREFDPSELYLVEALRTMRLVHQAGWMGARWEDPAFPLAFPWFDTLQYWERHISDLREQIAAMSEGPLHCNV